MPQWVRWVGILIGLGVAVWIAWRLIEVLLILAFSLVLTSALLPIVRWLDARRLPHWLSVSLSMLAMLAVLVGIIAYLVPVISQQAQQFSDVAPDLEGLELQWGIWHQQYPFLPSFAELTEWVSTQTAEWARTTLGITGRFLMGLIGTFTVLFLTFFFLLDGKRLLSQVLSLFAPRVREDALPLLDRVGDRVGRYVLGRLITMVLVGVLTAIGLAIVGLPYSILLGVLAGVLDIIPYLGPFLAAAPGVAIALADSWQTALWVALVYFIVQQAESYLVGPFVLGRSVGLHPVWIVLALLIGAELMGIVGMILAIPTVSALKFSSKSCITRVLPPASRV